MFVFFFKQKTAYEMRISDWSSDVCSSDRSPSVVQTHRRAYRVLPVWNDAPRDEKWRFCAPRQGVSRSEAESRRKPSAIVPLSRGTADSLPPFLKKRRADKDISKTGRASCRERVD